MLSRVEAHESLWMLGLQRSSGVQQNRTTVPKQGGWHEGWRRCPDWHPHSWEWVFRKSKQWKLHSSEIMDSGVSLKKYRATWCSINFITLIIITLILIWFKIFIGTNCGSYECWCYFLPFLISIKSTYLCFLIIENESLMDSCLHMAFQSVALTLWVSAQNFSS